MKRLYNDTLKEYCQSIDELVLHPELASDWVVPQPNPGDQMILSHLDTPMVIQITHGQYSVQAEAWLHHATLVGIRDFTPNEKAYTEAKLASQEEGEFYGIWCDGVFCWGESGKFLDYREWVIKRLMPEDAFHPGFDDETLRMIRVKNELFNLNLTNYGDDPLFVEGVSMQEMIKWARPASDNLPIVGNFNFRRDKEAFIQKWTKLNDELNRLRRVGKVSGFSETLKKEASDLIIHIAAFGQRYTRESEWKILTLWGLRLVEALENAPMFTTVDDVLAPVKTWLNEFVFPER